jgi:hypothetical protein
VVDSTFTGRTSRLGGATTYFCHPGPGRAVAAGAATTPLATRTVTGRIALSHFIEASARRLNRFNR